MPDSPTPPLLLLPGSLCDERLFSAQIEHFSKSRKVIVADFTQLDSIESMARSALNSAPEKFVLAGLSMGGIVALQIMAIAPERVVGLALLDSNAWAGTENQLQVRQAQIADVQAGGEPALQRVLDTLYPRYVTAHNLNNQSLRVRVTEMAKRGGVETFVNHWRAIYSRNDLGHILYGISCPTLILCGADDVVCPPATHQRMACAIPHAKIKIIQDCGHLSTLEAANEVNAALQSLITTVSQQSSAAYGAR